MPRSDLGTKRCTLGGGSGSGGRYKVSRKFDLVTEPLRSDAGKVRRSQLRAERSPGSD